MELLNGVLNWTLGSAASSQLNNWRSPSNKRAKGELEVLDVANGIGLIVALACVGDAGVTAILVLVLLSSRFSEI